MFTSATLSNIFAKRENLSEYNWASVTDFLLSNGGMFTLFCTQRKLQVPILSCQS